MNLAEVDRRSFPTAASCSSSLVGMVDSSGCGMTWTFGARFLFFLVPRANSRFRKPILSERCRKDRSVE